MQQMLNKGPAKKIKGDKGGGGGGGGRGRGGLQ